MTPTFLPHRLAAVALAAGLLLVTVSCGDEKDSDVAVGPCAETEVTDRGENQRPAVSPRAGGEVPGELVTRDLKPGTGAEAQAGDSITVNYIGIACSTGEVFDSSWERNMPLEGELVSPGLIEGWIQGVPGMKEGGRRVLVIPPSLAYGPAGQGTDIGPFETLFFVIDLVQSGGAPPADPNAPPDPNSPPDLTAVPEPSPLPEEEGATVPATEAPAPSAPTSS